MLKRPCPGCNVEMIYWNLLGFEGRTANRPCASGARVFRPSKSVYQRKENHRQSPFLEFDPKWVRHPRQIHRHELFQKTQVPIPKEKMQSPPRSHPPIFALLDLFDNPPAPSGDPPTNKGLGPRAYCRTKAPTTKIDGARLPDPNVPKNPSDTRKVRCPVKDTADPSTSVGPYILVRIQPRPSMTPRVVPTIVLRPFQSQ